MKGDRIRYHKGYKYQLAEPYAVETGIKSYGCITDYLLLTPDGILHISKGYAWDGPSGPTIDTRTSMRGSLVHDALYQLMRLGKLNLAFRVRADDLLHDICVEDGMNHIRAEAWEEAVKLFASGYAKAGSEPKTLEAP